MVDGSSSRNESLTSSFATPHVVPDSDLAASDNLAILIDALDRHETDDPAQRAVALRMAEFARSNDDALFRTCSAAHFTGSALVVEEGTGRFILLFHTKLQKWLQPGGHVDGNANLAASARREAQDAKAETAAAERAAPSSSRHPLRRSCSEGFCPGW